MENNEKRKKPSYKDYKYVYTGYKDYCKNHNIKVENITKEEKKIDHDHRFQFDFENPNQHTHDYSFDFPEKPQTLKKITTPPPEKKQYTSTNNRQYNTYNQNTKNYQTTNMNVNFKATKTFITVFIILFFVLPIIISIIETFTELKDSSNDRYDDYGEIYTTDVYENAVDDYRDAVENLDYSYLVDRITEEELNYDNGKVWKEDIESIKNTINSTYIYTFEYKENTYYLNSTELLHLQTNYNYKYKSNVIIDEAYRVMLKFYINKIYVYRNITIGKIDNTWYLISVV